MTNLDCAIVLLGFLCNIVSDTGTVAMDKVEAVAGPLWSLEEVKELAPSKNWKGSC